MNKNRLLQLMLFFVTAASVFLILNLKKTNPISVIEKTTSEKKIATDLPILSPQKTERSAVEVSHADTFYSNYFRSTLLGDSSVSQIYSSLIHKLPAGETSEVVATYISEGPIRNSSADFMHFMNSMLADIHLHSGEISTLIQSHDSVLKEDAFVYQMTLNLIFQLNLTSTEKAKLFGNAMTIHFKKNEQTGVELMSANITNAFILMKNSHVSLEEARPYILKGLETNRDDAEALTEFKARANTYFPGSI